jgi:vacuolar-type H+-ATPase subunit E/Vma4
MGLDALVAALERDAAEAREAVRASATRRAAEIREQAEARVAREREVRLSDIERDHHQASGARIAAATRAARLQVLEAERGWLEALRAEAEGALRGLPAARWAAAIPVLVATALRYAGPRAVTLRCAPGAEDAVWAIAGRRECTTVTGVEGMSPGVLLTSDDGRLAVPLTVEERLAVCWPDLQVSLLARLRESA